MFNWLFFLITGGMILNSSFLENEYTCGIFIQNMSTAIKKKPICIKNILKNEPQNVISGSQNLRQFLLFYL